MGSFLGVTFGVNFGGHFRGHFWGNFWGSLVRFGGHVVCGTWSFVGQLVVMCGHEGSFVIHVGVTLGPVMGHVGLVWGHVKGLVRFMSGLCGVMSVSCGWCGGLGLRV